MFFYFFWFGTVLVDMSLNKSTIDEVHKKRKIIIIC